MTQELPDVVQNMLPVSSRVRVMSTARALEFGWSSGGRRAEETSGAKMLFRIYGMAVRVSEHCDTLA